MYRTVRDNVLAAEADMSGCLALFGAPIVLIALVAKGCGLGPFWQPPRPSRPPAPAPAVAPAAPAPVTTASRSRRALEKAKKVWRVLRDD